MDVKTRSELEAKAHALASQVVARKILPSGNLKVTYADGSTQILKCRKKPKEKRIRKLVRTKTS